MADRFLLRILGVVAEVNCEDAAGSHMLQRVYGPLQIFDAAQPVLRYRIEARKRGYRLWRHGSCPVYPLDSGDLLYHFDKDLTLELQRRLPTLYFLHAAALVAAEGAVLLVASSGSGKSTTCWGALHHGFDYLSDELAPVELETLRIHAYPRAICLKREPAAPYGVPAEAIRTSRTSHVTPAQLLAAVATDPVPLAALVFLQYQGSPGAPALRRLSAGEAAARLYANALNQLCHADSGLSAAVRIGRERPCYFLDSGDLARTAELLARTFGTPMSTAA